jgi:hypothetical protein
MMKRRFLLALALAAVAVAVVGLVTPGGSGAQGSPYDAVSGAVKVTFPDFPGLGESTTEQLVLSAADGPGGVRGSIEFRSPLSHVHLAKADVTCMRVDGADAYVGGTFRQPFVYGGQSGFPASRIVYFVVQIRDNGASGVGVPDEVHPVVFDDRPRPPTFSPCNIPELAWFPIEAGNLVVWDAA